MDIRITPGNLSGKISISPSKSAAHRGVVCAMLASGVSELAPVQETRDICATIRSARALGAKTELSGGKLNVTGIAGIPSSAVLDCGESGSTLRFFAPVAAALGVHASFRGHGRLPQRPMDELVRVLAQHGISATKNENEMLGVSGRLQAGTYEISGNISSQYISGLLLALPLLPADSEIVLTSPLESRGYVGMTIETQKHFGVLVSETPTGWKIAGNQRYIPQNFEVEGDYSSAAFWLCAAALGGKIEAAGLRLNSNQGDRRILSLLSALGADVQHSPGLVSISRSELKAFDADVSQIPDLTPVLAVTAAFANGVSRLYNAKRLRLKESDRLSSVAAGLQALGATVSERADELLIIGQNQLCGGIVNSFGDHRIAMSMSIAASFCRNPSVISGAECVDKSYPDFYRDFASLGGMFDVL